jgi:MYXO-CTERM domain-containing protein
LSTTTSGSLSPAVVVGLAAGLFFAIRGYMRRRRSSS